MDYTSPNQDRPSNSKLSPPPPIGERTTRDHHQQQQSTNTNCTASITQALAVGPNNPNPDPITATRYRECLKNHAASSGGHVLDGCGEFMPASTDDALKCAACDCHRNFHRKETEPHHPNPNNNNNTTITTPRENQLVTTPLILLPRHQHYHNSHSHSHDHHRHHHRHQHPVMMAFGGAESSSDDLVNAFDHRDQPARLASAANNNNNNNKKRFRTKFKEGQKERMTEFAVRLGWRIQKHDEQEVQRFCSELGVKRQVFKVWMHNNKQAIKKKDNDGNSSDRQPNVSLP